MGRERGIVAAKRRVHRMRVTRTVGLGFEFNIPSTTFLETQRIADKNSNQFHVVSVELV